MPAFRRRRLATFASAAHFQTTAPLQPFYFGQASAGADIQPATEWTEITFVPGQYTPPIDVSYCYVSSLGANRGVWRSTASSSCGERGPEAISCREGRLSEQWRADTGRQLYAKDTMITMKNQFQVFIVFIRLRQASADRRSFSEG